MSSILWHCCLCNSKVSSQQSLSLINHKTANLLTLKSSKTEFLLIGLRNQLAKIRNFSLDTSTLLEISASSLINILPSLTTKLQISIHQLLFLPLLFSPNLITVILFILNSLSLNYPISSRSRTLLLILSLKFLSPVIPLPSYSPSTVAQNQWTHRILALLTYLQSSHNYPTSIPS